MASLWDLHPQLPVINWHVRYPVWSCASKFSVLRLQKYSPACLVVPELLICLLKNSKQPDCSPLQLSDYFPFPSVNPGHVELQFLKYSDNNCDRSKVTSITSLPHSDTRFELERESAPKRTELLPCDCPILYPH